jgi:hypothetical protein
VTLESVKTDQHIFISVPTMMTVIDFFQKTLGDKMKPTSDASESAATKAAADEHADSTKPTSKAADTLKQPSADAEEVLEKAPSK